MRKQSGFTLLELLTAIAIIAVLAALIFPVFAEAKKQAKGTQGLSQLRQIGQSLELYRTDSDQNWPAGVVSQIAVEPGTTWPKVKTLLEPYGAKEAVWRDPLDACPSQLEGCKGTWHASLGSSYDYFFQGWNQCLSLLNQRDPGCLTMNRITIDRDKQTKSVLLADGSARTMQHQEAVKRAICQSE